MKKVFSFFAILIFCYVFIFSQNSASSANKNTALRYLKNAENCLYAKDFQNALKQAENGLSYDDSISDLLYVKAAAMLGLSYSINEVLPVIQNAFEKASWSGYAKNGARILYADILSETGSYEESLNILDEGEAIFSADAEFIRIKNFYRIGSPEALNSARQRINSARRVFPSDSRFPKIFFLFEYAFLSHFERLSERQNNKYEIPPLVKTIASSYISSFPKATDDDLEIELLATFFAEGEEQKRLFLAIDAKNKITSPLLAILGLKTGLYSQSKAFEIFFNSSKDSVSLENLLNFASLLNETESLQLMAEKLANFDGLVTCDFDLNLIDELTVSYETGRPSEIRYDKNNDGVNEYFAVCDFGLPSLLYMEGSRTQIFYDTYPRVSKINFSNSDISFSFTDSSFSLSPFEFSVEPVFSKFGVNFFIPYLYEDFYLPENQDFARLANSVEIPSSERSSSKIIFTSDEGNLVFARFYEEDFNYAYCDFTKGLPFIRYVDYNNDGFFETTEYYDSIYNEHKEVIYNDDTSYVKRIFGSVFENEVYLKKVSIDSNANTIAEFSEQYLDKNGKITLWDNDDNGIPDCQYIRYPLEDDENLREDSIFFSSNGIELVTVQSINSVPVKCIYKEREVLVLSGVNENFYWLDERGSEEFEELVKNTFPNGLEQAHLEILQSGEQRFSVVRVAKNYFCMLRPESERVDNENASEDSSSENSSK